MKFSLKYVVPAVLTGLIIGLGSVSVNDKVSYGAAETPFGGQIQRTRVCDCTGNLWFQVGMPNSARVVFQPGSSKLYNYQQISRTGPWVLGNYRPGGECEYECGDSCCSEPTDGTVSIVGTSQ